MRNALSALALSLFSHIASAELEISDAYARATPPGQKVSAAFMQLHNASSQGQTLVGGRSDWSRNIEVHQSSMQDGVMQMRKLEGLTLPPGASQTLAPGGYHIMLMGLTKALTVGESLSLELLYENGEIQPVTLRVRAISGTH